MTHSLPFEDQNLKRVTFLADEWGSSKGGISTINRELAIHLAKFPELEITFFTLPRCSPKDKQLALEHKINIVEATPRPGFQKLDWLSFPPEDLKIDVIIGNGVQLGRQAQIIKKYNKKCKWIQVVHTDPEELAMFKSYPNPISKGEEKYKNEVALCKMADLVMAIGPKLAEIYRQELGCQKDVFDFTPGLFQEFQSKILSDRATRKVLVFGRGDAEDFALKGFDIAGKAIASMSDTNLIFVGAQDQERVANLLDQAGVPRARLKVRSFMKSREELNDLFRKVDLVVMPSRTEGFGLTGLEALSAGLPVLVCRNSGFGQALSKITFGSNFVVDSEDPTDWAKAINNVWAKDIRLRLEEVANVRNAYENKHSWKRQTGDLFQRIVSMVESSGSMSEERAGGEHTGTDAEDNAQENTPTSSTHPITGEQAAFNSCVFAVKRYFDKLIRKDHCTIQDLKDLFDMSSSHVEDAKQLISELITHKVFGIDNIRILRKACQHLPLKEELVQILDIFEMNRESTRLQDKAALWIKVHAIPPIGRNAQTICYGALTMIGIVTLPRLMSYISANKGSICFLAETGSLSSLKELWSSYRDGSLQEKFKTVLNEIQELKELNNWEEIDLTVEIDEEEFDKAVEKLSQLQASISINGRVRITAEGEVIGWTTGRDAFLKRYKDNPETVVQLMQKALPPGALATDMVVLVRSVLTDSFQIDVDVRSVDVLEELWKRFKERQLRKELQKVIVTDDVRSLAPQDADDVDISVMISEDDYRDARDHLMTVVSKTKGKDATLLPDATRSAAPQSSSLSPLRLKVELIGDTSDSLNRLVGEQLRKIGDSLFLHWNAVNPAT